MTMKSFHRFLVGAIGALVTALLVITWERPANAYVEAPHSLGQVITLSTNIMVLRVEQVDREKNTIIYRKVRDLKGVHPTDIIRHNIGRGGYNEREWKYSMQLAEVGKLGVFFHNGGQGEMCQGTYWYQVGLAGEWWNLVHGEPFLLRSYAGNVDKLAAAVADIVAGREVVVSCMVDGNKDELHLRRAKMQRLRASLKLADYNEKRDFVGWGGEDFRRVSGMPAFTHISALTRVDADAQAVSITDFDGDGKLDICLAGAGRLALLQNAGESFNEVSLPSPVSGCRAAVWADYNGDGRPDLLVATPTGPKLFTNTGSGLRDDSHLLPKEAAWNLTAAAWLDYDGDGRPDILLGNGFHGLRLYRNKGPADPKSIPLRLGSWHFIGPFDNSGGKGFAAVYPPEKVINLTATYPGKNGTKATWKDGNFNDGQINNLALFDGPNNVEAVVYVYREIESNIARQVPISLGSDDGLVVWLNGEKLVSENVQRSCAADQNTAILKLRRGRNHLLLKVIQRTGDWAYYFQAKVDLPPVATWTFEDVSEKVGLGPAGVGSKIKGDTLTVCDVDGDGRPDFLYGAGTGLLVRNTPQGFVEVPDSGISYHTGHVGPVFGDFDHDGHPDLFVPQPRGCKLFRNDGTGHFVDVTEKAGLASFTGRATCAAWGDLDNDGHLDLVVGCLLGPNRVFRNKGDGTFEEATEAVGLGQRVFNTQAVCLADVNNDGVLDVIFNNEGQDSVILLGSPEFASKLPAVTFAVRAKSGVVGSKVQVRDQDGKLLGRQEVSGGNGRGGQTPATARFALAPGKYRVEVQFSNGEKRGRDITVAVGTPLRDILDEATPKLE
jgi:hypothetical protein